MDTLTLQSILSPIAIVCAIDQLPDFIEKGYYCWNVLSSSTVGLHWNTIGVILDDVTKKRTLVYQDSLGVPPTQKKIIDLINNCQVDEIIINKYPLQESTADTCGIWCVMLIFHLNSGGKFSDFLKQFHPINLSANDIKIKKLFAMREQNRKKYKSKDGRVL